MTVRARIGRLRLPVVVGLTLVPGLVWPALFSGAVYEFLNIQLRLGHSVTRFQVIPGSKVARLVADKRASLARVVGFNRAGERVPGDPRDNDVIHIDLPPRAREALEADLPRSTEGYQQGGVWQRGRYQRARVRYRGDSGWHWLFERKSFKLRVPKARLLRGHREVSLSVKQPYTATIALDIARTFGLLAPEAAAVKVFVNGAFHGLEAFLPEVDETFLLSALRMPGTIYKGEGNPSSNEYFYGMPLFWLYRNPYAWGKHARDDTLPPNHRAELVALARALNAPDAQGRAPLRDLVDLPAMARLLAYTLFLQEFHQDDIHNQKLYLDPTDGKLHPIVWDPFIGDNARAFLRAKDDRAAPLGFPPPIVTHLLYALGREPAFCARAYAFLFERLRAFGPVEQNAVWKRWRGHATRNRFAFALEPSQPLLPQGEHELGLIERALAENRARLLGLIGRGAGLVMHRDEGIVLGVRGLGGAVLRSLEVEWAGRPEGLWIAADRNRDLALDPAEARTPYTVRALTAGRYRIELSGSQRVLPAYAGINRMVPVPLPHPFLLPQGARVVGVDLRHGLTGAPLPVTRVARWPFTQVASRHPWDAAPAPSPEVVTLEHPVHFLEQDLLLGAHQTLRILPGTEVRLARGASIVCRGKVLAEGTAAAPITLRPARPDRRWGVLALQGAAASGSRLAHVTFTGGGRARLRRVRYPGMVSVHWARDVRFTRCTFSRNRLGDDALRAAHSEVHVLRCVFRDVNADAIDFDYSAGTIAHSRFEGVGNDAIDLMRSSPTISGNLILRCGDKGISIGERSEPLVFNTVIRACQVGVQIKDRSQPLLAHCEISHCKRGVDVTRKNWRYGGGGRGLIVNSRLAGNDRDVVVGERSQLDLRACVVDGLDRAALRAQRLFVENVRGTLAAATAGAPAPDPRVEWRLQRGGFEPVVGRVAVQGTLTRRPLLLAQRFRDGFRLEAHGWVLAGARQGERLYVEEEALRAPCDGQSVMRLILKELSLPAGARLHLRLSASRAGRAELQLREGERSRAIPIALTTEERWVHLALQPGSLRGLTLRPATPTTVRLRRLEISGPGRAP